MWGIARMPRLTTSISPESKKIVVRQDVKFMEERAFKKSREMSSAT